MVTTVGAVAAGHDDARLAVVVPDQLAAGAARRHHRDGLVGLGRLGMAHRDDGVDAGLAEIGDRAAERDRLGAHRHAAEIGIEIDAGDDAAVARAHRRADLLPVVAIALLDRRARRLDQFDGPARSSDHATLRHFASSFRPSRISRGVSAPSPASRAAAAMAAAACG